MPRAGVKSKQVSTLGEFGLIRFIQKRLGSSRSAVIGIGDDTAVIPWTKDKYLLFTTDMFVEGVHFTRRMSPDLIGRKVISANISDIAAMGGRPKYALVSLAIPKSLDTKFISKLYQGMKQASKQFKSEIIGGDTVCNDKIVINVSYLGETKKDHLVKRRGAKPGDQIFVTGPLGNSLKSQHHLKFTPRVKQSQFLVKNCKPSSMIDLSDGLAADLNHILQSSSVGAVISEDKIPIRDHSTLHEALHEGEDFELLFTVSKKNVRELLGQSTYRFRRIGEIVRQKGLKLITRAGREKILKAKGFVHF